MTKHGRGKATTRDERNVPAYPVAEAARYLRLPVATLRSWVSPSISEAGVRPVRRAPLIRPASTPPPTLSFWNLIEGHVLKSLRTVHGVSIGSVREAIRYAEKELGIERLLLRKELCTRSGSVFLDRYSELINLSASGQFAMMEVLKAHLERVERDTGFLPIRLRPFMPSSIDPESVGVFIDPRISFGRPVLDERCISTAVLADRVDAGESISDLALDYGISPESVKQALLYERAA